MPTSLGALLTGGVLGAFSAVLIVALTAESLAELLPSIWPIGVFLASWLLSAWVIARQTARLVVVLKRAFAIGASEWLLLVLLRGDELVASAQSADAPAPAAPAESLVGFLSGGLGTVMLWVCVAGFVVCWLTSRRTTVVEPD